MAPRPFASTLLIYREFKILPTWHRKCAPLGEWEAKMTRMVDIFAKLPDGSPMWIESVEVLESARARVRELNTLAPRDYFIYSEQNGSFQREDH